MKFKNLQQIPIAITFSELEARAKQNSGFDESNWEGHYGLYYERDFEAEGNRAILEQAMKRGFFPLKEKKAAEKTLKGMTLCPAERQEKARFIKRARRSFGISATTN